MELPDFLIIPSILIKDKDLQPLDREVFGVVYWAVKLKNEKCTMSNKTIAQLLGASISAVSHSLTRLGKNKYVLIKLNESNHREEILPLISLKKDTPSSNELPPLLNSATPPSSNEQHNKNNKNNISYSKDTVRETDATKGKKEKRKTTPIEEKFPNEWYEQLHEYYQKVTGRSSIPTYYTVQRPNMKRLFKAGKTVEDIKYVIDQMARDDFWRDKGFDFASVYKHFHRHEKKVAPQLSKNVHGYDLPVDEFGFFDMSTIHKMVSEGSLPEEIVKKIWN